MTRRLPAAAAALIVTLLACDREPALLRRAREVELVDEIRQALLASVEAEKSAVLATTDEESVQLAREARDQAARIERLRDDLRERVVEGGRPAEVAALDAFDARWKELEDVDRRLLALAVANTNLKAARLSAREGMAAVDRLVDELAAMQRASDDPSTIRTLGEASVAALRKQSLLLIHIPVADEAEMTRLEGRMAALDASVAGVLAGVRATPGVDAATLAAAESAWSEHRRIAAEVVRLSRENTNVRSFDVSVHEKRKVTRECLDALAALEAAIESRPVPSR